MTNVKTILNENFTLSVPASEQETCINWYRNDDTAEIYTTDNTMLTKLKKLISSAPENYEVLDIGYNSTRDEDGNIIKTTPCSVTIKTPLKCISLRQGKERTYTEEERKALKERMSRIRKSNTSND